MYRRRQGRLALPGGHELEHYHLAGDVLQGGPVGPEEHIVAAAPGHAPVEPLQVPRDHLFGQRQRPASRGLPVPRHRLGEPVVDAPGHVRGRSDLHGGGPAGADLTV